MRGKTLHGVQWGKLDSGLTKAGGSNDKTEISKLISDKRSVIGGKMCNFAADYKKTLTIKHNEHEKS